MVYKIIFKNFKNNLGNYILFFISNMIAVTELFAFWGIRSVVGRAVTDASTAFALKYDFRIAAGLVTITTMLLMLFSMQYYVRMRIRDYSIFLVLGMKKRVCYLMIFAEYCMAWLCSFLVGLLLGNGILYGLQHLLWQIYPKFIRVQGAGIKIYRNTFFLSAGIMAVVFLGLLIWLDGRNLSALMQKSTKKEKAPVNRKWILFVLLGIAVTGFGVYEFQGNDAAYMASHAIWAAGSFLILAFGGGVVLAGIRKRRTFYLRRALKLNQMYSRYISNLLIVFLLFVLHFFALTYLTTEIAGSLPLDRYRENYPYDFVWMSQEKDTEFGNKVKQEYRGETQEIQAVRVCTMYGAEHIGISAASYVMLTGRQVSLAGREILVGIEDHNFQKSKRVTDEGIKNAYNWLYMGKYTPQMEELDMTKREDTEQTFQVKEIFTEKVLGQYSIDQWSENLIVFPDSFFKNEWQRISKEEGEPSTLQLFTFPKNERGKACSKLTGYARKYGVRENAAVRKQSLYYATEEFLVGQKMRALFALSSKLFLMASLLLSSAFVIGLKTISELPEYERRFQFLACMGMKRKDYRKLLHFEVQSASVVSWVAAALMAVLYGAAYACRQSAGGTELRIEFWKYWGILICGYLLLQYLSGWLFARYVQAHLKRRLAS